MLYLCEIRCTDDTFLVIICARTGQNFTFELMFPGTGEGHVLVNMIVKSSFVFSSYYF